MTTRRRDPRSEDELRAMSHHVVYSMTMLFATTRRLTSEPRLSKFESSGSAPLMTATSTSLPSRVIVAQSPVQDQLSYNAALESSLIQFRRLRDFFFSGATTRRDDSVAEDFLTPDAKWTELRPTIPTEIEALKDPIDKHLAHLTYNPVATGKLSWPVRDLAASMEDAFRAFFNLLPEDRKAWFSGVFTS